MYLPGGYTRVMPPWWLYPGYAPGVYQWCMPPRVGITVVYASHGGLFPVYASHGGLFPVYASQVWFMPGYASQVWFMPGYASQGGLFFPVMPPRVGYSSLLYASR